MYAIPVKTEIIIRVNNYCEQVDDQNKFQHKKIVQLFQILFGNMVRVSNSNHWQATWKLKLKLSPSLTMLVLPNITNHTY
jgi:hypothetical protein